MDVPDDEDNWDLAPPGQSFEDDIERLRRRKRAQYEAAVASGEIWDTERCPGCGEFDPESAHERWGGRDDPDDVLRCTADTARGILEWHARSPGRP